MLAKSQLCPIFLCLFVLSSLLSMNDISVKSNNNEDIRMQESQERKFYYGSTKKELENIFQNAPSKVKNIVNRLQNPYKFMRGNTRAAFLVGDSGVGKTTLSKAIVYMAGPEWLCEFITPSSIKCEEKNSRGQTARNLFKKLNMIINVKSKCVVIVDELNRLLENYQSVHHDTDEIADTLWTFLDAQKHNYDFFLIGTMNRANKLPRQIRSRIKGLCIEIPKLDSIGLVNAFLNKISDDIIELHAECDNEYLATLFQDRELTGRDLDTLIDVAVDIFRRSDMHSEIVIIRKEHINQAFHEIQDVDDRLLQCDLKEETEEERQERHHDVNVQLHRESQALQIRQHQESLNIQNEHYHNNQEMQIRHHDANLVNQNKHFEENQNVHAQFQRENLQAQTLTREMQEKHFVQQQWIQVSMNDELSNNFHKDRGLSAIKNVLTDQQIQTVDTIINQNNMNRPEEKCIIQ